MPVDPGFFFVDLLGEDRVVAIEASLPELNKDLQAAGVAWKELEKTLAPVEKNEEPEEKPEAIVNDDSGSTDRDSDNGDNKETVAAGVDEKALAATINSPPSSMA